VKPQPPYSVNWKGWGPRLGLTWQVRSLVKTPTISQGRRGITPLVTYPFANNERHHDFPFFRYRFRTAQPTAASLHASVLPFSTPDSLHARRGPPLSKWHDKSYAQHAG